MKSMIIALVLRFIAKIAVEDLWPIIRATLVRTMDGNLVNAIEELVAVVDPGDMSGESKAEWVRRQLRNLAEERGLPMIRTPSHLVNLAIEYAVAKLRGTR